VTTLDAITYWRKQLLLEQRWKSADANYLAQCDKNIRYHLCEADKNGSTFREQNEALYRAETDLLSEGYALKWL
jgi:ABC-type oligopeptide transport system substrate-binding subunit